ncbi:hypothetical protein NW752_000165 [Fusarium irregulare]|nr:hypothetical protein NW752_000165 [Fusarium irregulare]
MELPTASISAHFRRCTTWRFSEGRAVQGLLRSSFLTHQILHPIEDDYTALKESRHHQDFASQVQHVKLLVRVVAYPKLNDNVVIREPDPITRNFSLLSPPLIDNIEAEQDTFVKAYAMVEMAHFVYFDSPARQRCNWRL